MKNLLFAACLLLFACLGCSKRETGCMPVKPETEEPQIVAYAAKDSIHAIKHSSGIYYEIIDPGTGDVPTKSSTITVGYVGKFLNGNTFDQNTSYTTKLSDVIEGWQIGIPMIKQGGHIKLVIPSAYAYGCNPRKDSYDNVVIPGNSVLFFDVTLTDVQ